MSRIRAVDKAIQAGLSAGKFFFSYWPMTGQEAIPGTVPPWRSITAPAIEGLMLPAHFAREAASIDGGR